MSDLIIDIGLIAISFTFCLFIGILIYKDSKEHKEWMRNFNKDMDELLAETELYRNQQKKLLALAEIKQQTEVK